MATSFLPETTMPCRAAGYLGCPGGWNDTKELEVRLNPFPFFAALPAIVLPVSAFPLDDGQFV